MGWSCYSCGTKNPNSADECQKCGGTVAAPSNFYIGWVFGGAIFFLVVYIAGTLAGGVLVDSMNVFVRVADSSADGGDVVRLLKALTLDEGGAGLTNILTTVALSDGAPDLLAGAVRSPSSALAL